MHFPGRANNVKIAGTRIAVILPEVIDIERKLFIYLAIDANAETISRESFCGRDVKDLIDNK